MQAKQDETGQWWIIFRNGNRTRGVVKNCALCGEEFVSHPSKHRLFCSPKCAQETISREPTTRPCKRCGLPFRTRQIAKDFCCPQCRSLEVRDVRFPQPNIDASPSGLIGANNPRYSQDDLGRWWYTPLNVPDKSASRSRAFVRECEECHSRFLGNIYRKNQRFCSRKCAAPYLRRTVEVLEGPSHPSWKGGRIKRKGYVWINLPGHHSLAGKGAHRRYVREHRVVMEGVLSRNLEPNEVVHHKNGIKDDNRPENLELWSHGHPPGQRDDERPHCPTCTCFSCK